MSDPEIPEAPDRAGEVTPGTPTSRNRMVAIAGGGLAVVLLGVVAFVLGRNSGSSAPAPQPAPTTIVAAPPAGPATKPTGSVPASPADAQLASALTLHQAGKLDDATKIYRQILDADKTNKYAAFNLGQIAQSRNSLDEAITWYEQALAIDAKYAPALYNVGLAYSAKTNYPKAIDALQRAIAVSPSPEAKYNLGKALLADNKTDEGAKLVAAAIAENPKLAAAVK